MSENRPSAYDAAGRYLALQARTRSQVSAYLSKKGYEQSDIESALKRLEEYKYIDDSAFAAAFIRSRDNSAPLSRRALLAELKKRGIDSITAGEAAESITDEQEYIKAKALAEKIARTGSADGMKLRHKQFRALASRGFDYSLISEVLGEQFHD